MESPTPKAGHQDPDSIQEENIPCKRPLRFTPARLFRNLLSGLLGIAIFLPLLTAVGIFGYQIYSWAKHGSWVVFTYAKFASLAGLPPASSLSPDSWLGIANAVETIYRLPAALVLIIFAVGVAVISGIFQRK
ncbi:MAG: hypothetical protein AB9919_10630 [Geobacteraceae bacterium]